MSLRIPLFAAPWRCAMPSVAPRVAAVSLSTSARLSVPGPKASSSASFLDLDQEFGRPRGAGSAGAASRGRSAAADTSAALSAVLFSSESKQRMSAKRESLDRTVMERMAERKASDDYGRHAPRRWQVGDVYAPHDLSPAEAAKWRRLYQTPADVFDVLGIDPRDEYRNFAIISEFVSPMGRIKHSALTGLRPVNQRRLAKAVRRAIGLGLHPSVHHHPEILAAQVSFGPRQVAPSNNRRRPFQI